MKGGVDTQLKCKGLSRERDIDTGRQEIQRYIVINAEREKNDRRNDKEIERLYIQTEVCRHT